MIVGLECLQPSCSESTAAFSSLRRFQEPVLACPIHLVSNGCRGQTSQIREYFNWASSLQGEQSVVECGDLNGADALAARSCEHSGEVASLEKRRLQAVPYLSARSGDDFVQWGILRRENDAEVWEFGAEPLHILEVYLCPPGEESFLNRRTSNGDLNPQDPMSGECDAAPIAVAHVCVSVSNPFIRPVDWLTGNVREFSCSS